MRAGHTFKIDGGGSHKLGSDLFSTSGIERIRANGTFSNLAEAGAHSLRVGRRGPGPDLRDPEDLTQWYIAPIRLLPRRIKAAGFRDLKTLDDFDWW